MLGAPRKNRPCKGAAFDFGVEVPRRYALPQWTLGPKVYSPSR